ncbi:MAG: 30S ribosomal protein S15 [Candidatus Anammoxibacter sp.]
MRLDKEVKEKTIQELKTHDTDTGSPEVQIGLITAKIRHLTEHLKEHKKDNSSRRGLINLVGQRSALMKYLRRRDSDRYKALISKLGIRG